MLSRNSFCHIKRPGSYETDDAISYYSYRIGGRERKGDVDYDLLIRLLLCLVYGTQEDSSMLLPAGSNLSLSLFFINNYFE